jgi:uncharacterized hydrophobic protein (TIGR00271 family)
MAQGSGKADGNVGRRVRPVAHAFATLRRRLRNLLNIREGRASYLVIRRRFVNGARLDGTHLCILVVAMLIACIGLNTNSTEAIVGAMLICPLMNSVLAISYGVATADRRVFRTALEGLLVQVAFCLVTSTIYFRLTPLVVETSQILDKSTPTVWDLMIALAGGFAGGLGNSRRQEPATIISGVAVATALMPPLCAAGYGIAVGSLTRFLGATYEFAINVVFIALACELVLLLLRVPLARDLGEDGEPKQVATAATRERASDSLEGRGGDRGVCHPLRAAHAQRGERAGHPGQVSLAHRGALRGVAHGRRDQGHLPQPAGLQRGGGVRGALGPRRAGGGAREDVSGALGG